ncbi:MAG: hypothetical protein ABWZ99_12625 [Ilumatobacteraceae bacterium]
MPALTRVRILVPMLFAALLVSVGPASPAAAVCDCTKLPVPAALAEATVVFTGDLQTVESEGPLTVMGFQVDAVYKGDIATSFSVATFSNIDECGLGTAPPLGRWLVFAVQFPPENGVFYASACGPTGLLGAEPLAPELGAARLPVDATPVTTTSPPTTAAPVVGPPQDSGWKRPVLLAAAAMAGLGLVSRLLAGRRRVVV